MEDLHYNNLNNNRLNFSKAMPNKDSTSDGSSTFGMGRRTYINMFSNLQPINQNTNSKKWYGQSNRDASSIAEKRRNSQIGKGTLNLDINGNPQTISFCSNNDINLINRRKMFTRSSGSVVPMKCRYKE